MDWRTSDEQQHPRNEIGARRAAGPARAGLADAAGATLPQYRDGRFCLEPALTRDLQMARITGGRFGAAYDGLLGE